jgi:hypothetical protein
MKIRKLIIPAVAALIVFIGYLSTRPISDPTIHGPVTLQWAHASEIRMVLFSYSQNHRGHFPNKLSDLPPSEIPPDAQQFHDPNTKEAQDWTYYPGYSHENLPDTIIMASPRVVAGHKRIVVYSDCSASIIEEDDFARRISDQLNRK